ncbi:hypothetical protein N9Q05_01570 [bacterium]|nr:hypothetical protein [bacterium]
MAESQSILSQLQQKKADIERQLCQLQGGMDELSGEEYEEPEEEQNEEQEEYTKEEDTKEEDTREEDTREEDTREEDIKDEPEEPVVADYKSDNDDRLAKKINSIIDKKTIVRQCQKKIDKLAFEVVSHLNNLMDNIDDLKEITKADLQHLAAEYTDIMEEFSHLYKDILEELPAGYTLPKAFIVKLEKTLDQIEEDVNKYL